MSAVEPFDGGGPGATAALAAPHINADAHPHDASQTTAGNTGQRQLPLSNGVIHVQQRLYEHASPPGMLEESPPASQPQPQAQHKQHRPTPLNAQNFTPPHKTANGQKHSPNHVVPVMSAAHISPQALHPAHPAALREHSLSESYYSDDGDPDSSDDESPREERVLTFADEHGRPLVAVHWYEPDASEDNRVAPVSAYDPEEGVEAGCGSKCVIL